tara:strand:+ start:110 stop:256 length:147 start_codon:yes stop_codon:yes gene_type:complete
MKLCERFVFILRIPPLNPYDSNMRVFIVWEEGVYENIETVLDFNYIRL